MKLLRVGQKGSEKPAILDKDGKIRDLSSHIQDLNPDTLNFKTCLLYTSPSPRDQRGSRMPSSA